MDIYSKSDKAILAEIGSRFRRLRLRRDLSQEQLAMYAQVSISTIKSLEAGAGKLSTIIAVLRELKALDQIENFIPEPSVSPVQLLERAGKERQRASGREPKISHKKKDEQW